MYIHTYSVDCESVTLYSVGMEEREKDRVVGKDAGGVQGVSASHACPPLSQVKHP